MRPVLDVSLKGVEKARLLAGPGPLPEGALLLGLIQMGSREGALVQFKSGTYVQWNAGVTRTLNQEDVKQALEVYECSSRG